MLAAELDELGAVPGLVVARLPNCLTAATAVFGVLRSRHALLMVHPGLPDEVCAEALRRLPPVAELRLDGSAARVTPEPYGAATAIWQPPVATPGLGIALCVLTSGTTGRPRVIAAPHQQMLTAIELIDARLGYRPDDVVAVVSPLSFDYGLYQLLLSVRAGSTAILDPRLDTVSGVLAAIARSASVLPLVPSMLRALTAAPFLARQDTSGVRLITTTGDLLTEADTAAAAAGFPAARIQPMYGLSECKRVAITPAGAHRPAGAVGIALAGTDVAVTEQGDRSANLEPVRLAPDVAGELVVAGPHLSLGYLEDEAATALRFSVDPRNGVRLLHTGDRLRQDADGWLTWVGRGNDVIKTSGYRLDPAELETAAAQSEQVIECGAYGRPDPARGQVPVLVVRLRPEIDLEQGRLAVLEQLRRRLPLWAAPEVLVSLAELPHSANGKIDRARLAAAAATMADAGPSSADPGRPLADAVPSSADGVTGLAIGPRCGVEQPIADLSGEWFFESVAAFPRSVNLINCHTQALLSGYALPRRFTPALVELATTVPFGVRADPEDPSRLLIPYLDPDLGLDRAGDLLGLRMQTEWHDPADGDQAMNLLDDWLRTTAVLLGPLDLGHLAYHELAGTLAGSDHYLIAVGRSATGGFVVLDSEGLVQVEIDEPALRRAWHASAVPEGRGAFMLRRLLVERRPVEPAELPERIAALALENLLAAAGSALGGSAGYRALAGLALTPSTRRGLSMLLPVTAARYRLAARFVALLSQRRLAQPGWQRLGELLEAQVPTLARAHRAVLDSDGPAALLTHAAEAEDRLTEAALALRGMIST